MLWRLCYRPTPARHTSAVLSLYAVCMRVRLLILCCCMYVGAPAAAAVAMLWRRSVPLHTRRSGYGHQRRRYPRPGVRCVAQTVQSSARGAVLSAAAAVAEPPPPAPPAQTTTTAAAQPSRRRRAMDGRPPASTWVRLRLRRWCIGAERRRRSRLYYAVLPPVVHCMYHTSTLCLCVSTMIASLRVQLYELLSLV